MRIDTGHICKNCCYYTIDEGDTIGYCCIEPLYTTVKAHQAACTSYVSDSDEDYFEPTYIVGNNDDRDFYGEEDDEDLY